MKKILHIFRLIGLPLVIIFVDVFFNGMPMVSVFISLAIILYMIPKTILSLIIARKRDKFRGNLIGTLIYLATVILVFSALWLDSTIAANRAQSMVDAVERYNLKHQRYPDRLEELVPEFAARIPAPRLLWMGSRFYYNVNQYDTAQPKKHNLIYVSFPPFGRRGYSFEGKNWYEFD